MTSYDFTQLSAIAASSIVPTVVLPVVDPNDTTTAPAGSGGSNKQMTLSQLRPGVVWPSGDTTGAKDEAAISAQVTAGADFITLAPGQWYLPTNGLGITVARPVWMYMAGVTVNGVTGGSAGPLIRWYDSSNMLARTYAGGGILGNPVFLPGTAPAGSTALHAGDITQFNAWLQTWNWNGSGSKGVWFDNQYYWCEQMQGLIYAANCSAHVVFDNSANTSGEATGSYDRMNLNIYLNQQGAGDGVVFQGGALAQNMAQLGIFGNFNTATTQYAALRITGNNTALAGPDPGYSFISKGCLNMGVELDDGVHLAPYTIYFGSANNNCFECSGLLDFSSGNDPFTASNKSNNFSYYGQILGDTTLSSVANIFPTQVQTPYGLAIGNYAGPTALTANGQTIPTSVSFVPVTAAAAYTGLILATAGTSGQMVTVVNQSANALTFAAAGTSNVADGTADVIPALTSRTFYWDTNTSLWYRAA